MIKRILSVLALLFLVLSFQNCSPTPGFSTQQTSSDPLLVLSSLTASAVKPVIAENVEKIFPIRGDLTSLNMSYEKSSCYINDSGEVFCFGSNSFGQLGNGTDVFSDVPQKVKGIVGRVVALQGYYLTYCALTDEGKIFCWGDSGNNDMLGFRGNKSKFIFQIGHNYRTDAIQLAIPGNPRIVQMSKNCAVSSEHNLYCWGGRPRAIIDSPTSLSSSYEELAGPSRPTRVVEMDGKVKFVTGGGPYVCILNLDDAVSCWGANSQGFLGQGFFSPDNTNFERRGWVAVKGLPGKVKSLDSSGAKACALLEQGDVYCWGQATIYVPDIRTLADYNNMAVFDGIYHASPVKVAFRDVRSIHLGPRDICAITNAGKLECLGGLKQKYDSGVKSLLLNQQAFEIPIPLEEIIDFEHKDIGSRSGAGREVGGCAVGRNGQSFCF